MAQRRAVGETRRAAEPRFRAAHLRAAQAARPLEPVLGRLLEIGGTVSLLALLHEHRRPIPLTTLRTFQILLVRNMRADEVGEHRNLKFVFACWATICSTSRVPSY